MPEEYRFDVFGRAIAVARKAEVWTVFDIGEEGKRRRADIQIPAFIAADELLQYLDDIFHESATPARPCVRVLPDGRRDLPPSAE
ncbi:MULTISPECIES: DUF7661 family protein [Paraburkholderia]|uniref:DUF7661 domain-containing protein n=3 Tax=Paraburkholderia TaxID=1822464 RepID=A0ABU9SN71_9BURK|nr:hypothetical protein [Paraburkholderia nodosa]